MSSHGQFRPVPPAGLHGAQHRGQLGGRVGICTAQPGPRGRGGEQWGGPGFRPVAGDYDGDGLWDYAIYDVNSGRWYIVNMHLEMLATGLLWGAPGYLPVSGDFDGDGIHDLAVYNAAAAKWYIRTLGGNYIALDVSWGGPGRQAVGGVD